MANINYKHLRYFWVVARAGGVAAAALRLHVTPQTVSGQLSLFEGTLGFKLFNRARRRLELTDMGRVVLSYADEIFTTGEELEGVLHHPGGGRPLLLRAGIVDAVPKSVAFRLLEPALQLAEPVRMVCREDKLANLLGELASYRIDIVIADGPMPASANVKGFSHLLGECGVTFFATPELAKRHKARFPRCLDGAPLLLPGEDSQVRPRLMRWLERERVKARVIGEFDDSALMTAFGQVGVGIFVAPSAIAREVVAQYGVVAIGGTGAVTESYYAISVERRLTHPAVVAISSEARKELFRKSRR
jgi:LysR family transcriptional activator of nhaA